MRRKYKMFLFRKGDIVEWTDEKVRHEGKILGNTLSIRANFWHVKDLADGSLYVIHGARLSKVKIKVGFD